MIAKIFKNYVEIDHVCVAYHNVDDYFFDPTVLTYGMLYVCYELKHFKDNHETTSFPMTTAFGGQLIIYSRTSLSYLGHVKFAQLC